MDVIESRQRHITVSWKEGNGVIVSVRQGTSWPTERPWIDSSDSTVRATDWQLLLVCLTPTLCGYVIILMESMK
jgi:hypothetical protein